MQDFKNGSITIYMTLVFAVILSLFLTLIEGARSNAIAVQSECAFDMAMYSVFAEYNRELEKQYHLFFVDSSYGEMTSSLDRVNNHFSYYLNENLESEKKPSKLTANITGTFLETSHISDVAYATDEKGAVFERQAIMYMEQKYGISYIKGLEKELVQMEDYGLFSRDVTREREDNERILEKEKRELEETNEVDENGNPIFKEIDLDNPADQVNQSRPKGILYLVTEAEKELSMKSISPDCCTSRKGARVQGNGLTDRETISASQKLLFDAYILDHCGNYCSPKPNGDLQYQVEYIIAEKNNDIDNLKDVVNRLLLLRETANVVYLFSDAAKLAEVEALAAAITSAAGAPLLLEPVKVSLIFAWAYAESVYDVKSLLAGKRVPIMKTSQTWHFSLEGMLHYESVMTENITVETTTKASIFAWKDGLSYEDYLFLFLAVKENQKKVYRMMDIIETDIRKTDGNQFFCIDSCIDKMTFEAYVGSTHGDSYEMKRSHYYK